METIDERLAGRASIERVYRADGNRLWWAVLAYAGDREVASDAVSEAFAQALRAGSGVRDPARWVWRAAFRIAAGELARRRRFAAPVDSSYEMDHLAHAVIEALAKLSPRQRAAIVLRYYGGYSARETASIIGSTAATVAVHVSRGRARLRTLLKEEESE
jgi:RNA polymerase sigma factor (sigma-70 family)